MTAAVGGVGWADCRGGAQKAHQGGSQVGVPLLSAWLRNAAKGTLVRRVGSGRPPPGVA